MTWKKFSTFLNTLSAIEGPNNLTSYSEILLKQFQMRMSK